MSQHKFVLKRAKSQRETYRILAVDDDHEILKWLATVFKAPEFEFYSAVDGFGALELCKKLKPDMMILDLHLGNGAIPGPEVLEAIKRDPQLASTTVFIFSGSLDESLQESLVSVYGADGYFLKGNTRSIDLLGAARAWLRRIKVKNANNEFLAGPLRINLAQAKAYLNSTPLPLSPREYNLLVYVAKKKGRAAAWDELARKILGLNGETKYEKAPPLLEVHLAHLRHKLGPAAKCLQTERGRGIRLTASAC